MCPYPGCCQPRGSALRSRQPPTLSSLPSLVLGTVRLDGGWARGLRDRQRWAGASSAKDFWFVDRVVVVLLYHSACPDKNRNSRCCGQNFDRNETIRSEAFSGTISCGQTTSFRGMYFSKAPKDECDFEGDDIAHQLTSSAVSCEALFYQVA